MSEKHDIVYIGRKSLFKSMVRHKIMQSNVTHVHFIKLYNSSTYQMIQEKSWNVATFLNLF